MIICRFFTILFRNYSTIVENCQCIAIPNPIPLAKSISAPIPPNKPTVKFLLYTAIQQPPSTVTLLGG